MNTASTNYRLLMGLACLLGVGVIGFMLWFTHVAPGYMSHDQYGDRWPLTVDSGEVRCVNGTHIIFVTDRWTFGVNGIARGSGKYTAIESIWRKDPNIEGARMDMTPIISKGLSLC